MATIVTCDVCGGVNNHYQLFKVEVNHGLHPHEGDQMTRVVDVCVTCLKNSGRSIRMELELDELKKVCRRS